MPTITVKNIPAELYESLKERAHEHRRSINSETIVCLEQSLRTRRASPKEILAKARVLRKKTKGIFLTDEILAKAKNTGRP